MQVDGRPQRTIRFEGDDVVVIDQTRLPHELAFVRWHTVEDAVAGIATMQVRGAPLIGVAAAHGLALAAAADPSDDGLRAAVARLAASRPTAVNLTWALGEVRAQLSARAPRERAAVARAEAQRLADEDVAACAELGRLGLGVLQALSAGPGRPVQVLTHCNAGWLAAVDWGTALAPVHAAAAVGLAVHVWVSETRPRNQGASLTAWELGAAGIPHTVVVDNAAGHLLRTGQVDACFVGADRIAANGDVANKVGTYLKAVAAADCGVPVYVVAPTSTIDAGTPDGDGIVIEERDPSEVTTMAGRLTDGDEGGVARVELVAAGSPARNWAFDVTPARLVTAIITEHGVVPATPAGIATALARAGRPWMGESGRPAAPGAVAGGRPPTDGGQGGRAGDPAPEPLEAAGTPTGEAASGATAGRGAPRPGAPVGP